MAVLVVLAFPAGYLLYAPYDGISVHGMPVPVYAGLLYAAGISGAGLLTCLVLPAMRFTIEAIAVGRLMLAAFVQLVPAVAVVLPTAPVTQATLIVAAGCIVFRVVHGSVLDGVLRRRSPTSQVRLTSRLDSTTLLNAFRPAARGTTDWVLPLRGMTTPDRGLSRLVEGSVDPETVASVDMRPTEGYLRIYHRCDKGRAPLWQEIRVEDRGSYRQVLLTVAHAPMPWHSAATAWLDDSYGRLADRIVAGAVRSRATATPAILQPVLAVE